jgi:hypothetical protein
MFMIRKCRRAREEVHPLHNCIVPRDLVIREYRPQDGYPAADAHVAAFFPGLMGRLGRPLLILNRIIAIQVCRHRLSAFELGFCVNFKQITQLVFYFLLSDPSHFCVSHLLLIPVRTLHHRANIAKCFVCPSLYAQAGNRSICDDDTHLKHSLLSLSTAYSVNHSILRYYYPVTSQGMEEEQ